MYFSTRILHIIVLILYPVNAAVRWGGNKHMLAHVYLLWYYLGKQEDDI